MKQNKNPIYRSLWFIQFLDDAEMARNQKWHNRRLMNCWLLVIDLSFSSMRPFNFVACTFANSWKCCQEKNISPKCDQQFLIVIFELNLFICSSASASALATRAHNSLVYYGLFSSFHRHRLRNKMRQLFRQSHLTRQRKPFLSSHPNIESVGRWRLCSFITFEFTVALVVCLSINAVCLIRWIMDCTETHWETK